jgi:hypothetical protein
MMEISKQRRVVTKKMPAKRKKSEKTKSLKPEFLITALIAILAVGIGLAYSMISGNFKSEPKEAEVYVAALQTPTPIPSYTEVRLGSCDFSVGVVNNNNCIQAVRARCKDRNQRIILDSNWINTTSCRDRRLCLTMNDVNSLFKTVTPEMIGRFRDRICQSPSPW